MPRWAREFLAFCDAKYPGISKRIEEQKQLPVNEKKDASDPELNKALTEFNAAFQKTAGAKV